MEGTEIHLGTNYFALMAKPDWRLLQYRVGMKPKIDYTGVRKRLLYVRKASLPKFIFERTILLTTTRLIPNAKPTVLTSKKETDGTNVEIIIKLVAKVQPTDYHYMQFFIVRRQAMENLVSQTV